MKLAPNNPNAWDKLGVALYRNGEWNEAVANLEKARSMRSGDDPLHRFFLAMAYWQADQKDLAQSEYVEALKWLDEGERPEEQHRFRQEADALLGASPLQDSPIPVATPAVNSP